MSSNTPNGTGASLKPFESPSSLGGSVAPAPGEVFSTDNIVRLRHSFHLHPAMRIESLHSLARRLHSTGQCRFIRPGTTIDAEFWHDPRSADGRDIDGVFARIDESGSWIALYNVETDPEYASFLDQVIGAMRERVEHEQPGVFNVSGFIFISAPPSVTPFHIDRENNFWLQVRGRKTLSVWDPRDRLTVSADSVERFIVSRDLRSVRLSDDALSRARVLDVGPGDGVYWPSGSPHMTSTQADWVRPGDALSVSVGVCFYTSKTRQAARVHQLNRLLRRVGLDPTPPGESPWRDAVKAPMGRIAALAQIRLRGYEPPPGAV